MVCKSLWGAPMRMGLSWFFSVLVAAHFSDVFADDAQMGQQGHGDQLSSDAPDFIIILDAGSTGTRANVFHYPQRIHRANHFPMILSSPLTIPRLLTSFETSPGISSFADRPHELASCILPIVRQAADAVEAHSRSQNISDIPIYLGATVGMRALNDAHRDTVMAAVRHTLAGPGCPFAYQRAEQARVLAGEEEGVGMSFAEGFITMHAGQSGFDQQFVMSVVE